MTETLTEQALDEVERLLSYYEAHGAVNGWAADAVTLLRALLPDWSAYKAEDES